MLKLMAQESYKNTEHEEKIDPEGLEKGTIDLKNE